MIQLTSLPIVYPEIFLLLMTSVVALVGVLILTGTNHILEGAVLAASPAWLTNLTTSI